jgi:RNA polymerase sigma-70 factor (ECF subfamily)
MSVAAADLMAHLPNLRRYARRLTENEDAANDLVQETLARALRNLDRYRPTGSLQGWLITIMKNQFRETRRRHVLDRAADPHRRAAALARAVPAGWLDAPQDDHLLLRELAAAIPRLPPFQRDVLVAVCFNGLSYEEASTRLGIPVGTIRSRLYRARAALQGLLEPDAPIALPPWRLFDAAAAATRRSHPSRVRH